MVANVDGEFFNLINSLTSGDDAIRNNAELQLKNAAYNTIFDKASSFLMAETDPSGQKIRDGSKTFTATLIKNRFPAIDYENKNHDGTVNFNEEMSNHINNIFTLYSDIGKIPTESIRSKFVIANLIVDAIVGVLSVSNTKLFQYFINRMVTTIKESKSENDCLIAIVALSKFSDSFKSHNIPDKVIVDIIVDFSSRVMQQIHSLGKIDNSVEDFSLELIKNLSYFVSYSDAKRIEDIRPLADLTINFGCFFLSQESVIRHWGIAFDNFVQIAAFRPRMFSPHLNMITDTVINVLLNNTVMMPGVKSSAIRFHSRLFVFLKKKFMQSGERFKKFVMLLCDLMDDPDDLDVFVDDDEEIDQVVQNSVSRQAEIAFDKMCCEEPDTMFEFVQLAVEKLFGPNSTPSQNVAGINIVYCAGEGCRKHYEKHIKEIIHNYILPMFHESKHPKIRYTALTALGVICTEFKSIIVDKLHSDIVKAYATALMNTSNFSVYKHAFLALNNFFEVCPEYLLGPVVRELTPCITHGLEQKSTKIVSQVISTIYQLAERDFRMDDFYSAIRGHLTKIIEVSSTNSETFDQTCLCLLTLCQVGSHVDKAMFTEDAQRCMKIIFSFLNNLLGDAYYKYDMKSLVLSLVVIANVLQNEFEPFVDSSLSLTKVLFQNLIDSSKENDPLTNEDVLQMLQNGKIEDEKYQVQTTLTETCTAACDLLIVISQALKESVFEKLNQFSGQLDQIINMPSMLLSAFETKSAIMILSQDNVRTNWVDYLQLTVKVYEFAKDTPDLYNETISIVMGTIEKLDKAFANENFMAVMDEIIMHGIDSQQACAFKSIQMKNFKDNEDIEENEDMENYLYDDDEESSYLEGVDKFIKTMLKITGNYFLPFIEKYAPKIWKFTENSELEEKDVFGVLSIWASILEFAPKEVCIRFKDPICDLVFKFSTHESPVVQRVAFFMINLIAKLNAAEFSQLVTSSLKNLTDFITSNSETVDDDTQLAIDNAISALSTILRVMPDLVGQDYASLACYVLQKLPLRSDLEETANTFEFIIQIIESNLYTKLDENGLHYLILSIGLGYEVLETQLEKSKLLPKVVTSIKSLKNNVSSFDQLISGFDDSTKNALRLLVSS